MKKLSLHHYNYNLPKYKKEEKRTKSNNFSIRRNIHCIAFALHIQHPQPESQAHNQFVKCTKKILT